MSISIRVNHISKGYKQYRGRWDRLIEWFVPGSGSRHTTKWVLKDIDFQVASGEAVGIIGMNGAGKSTLLKLITGTAQQTSGSIEIQGTVAALLELGMGFHPDFTGRQNAIMSGQLMGYSLEEIMAHMADIETFAEIGAAIDEPVRTYSSGMQVRLAFSVATAIRPDVLIVDEALSVGDAYFQHKSFARIRAFREQGTTLLLVSHDKAAVQSICDRAILLNEGTVLKEGKPEEIMDYYNALIAKKGKETVRQVLCETGKIQTVSGTGEVEIRASYLLNGGGEKIEVVEVGETVTLCVEVTVSQDLPRLVLGYMIKDVLGQVIYGTTTNSKNVLLEHLRKSERIKYEIKIPVDIGPGNYSVSVALTNSNNHLSQNYQWIDLAVLFSVINSHKPEFVGSNWLQDEVFVTRGSYD